MKEIPEDKYKCKYCSNCMCSEDTIGGAYCYADIHDWIFDVNDDNICSEFDYDDTFERT